MSENTASTALLLLAGFSALAGEAAARKHTHSNKHDPDSLAMLAQTYFDTWNAHDVDGLRTLLADDATLRDWDIEKLGAREVAGANGRIFAAVPKISSEQQGNPSYYKTP